MINAKEELLRELVDGSKIEAADLYFSVGNEPEENHRITLRKGHSPEELEIFFTQLDFEYNDGYGTQHLSGHVWFKDDSGWLTRGEYDGSEWWEYMYKPDIPEDLR